MLRSRLLPLLLLVLAPPLASAQEKGADPPILPGDLIRVSVLREKDLTGEFPVDQHGLVTLPLMGEIDVTGETELSLRRRVREALAHELRDPDVEVTVLKRVRVLGEVLEPGLFPLDPTMSVADALAMAGGRSPTAQEGKVTLRRDGEALVTDVREDMTLADLTVQTGDELLVRQRSWVSRNGSALITGGAALVGLLVALFR